MLLAKMFFVALKALFDLAALTWIIGDLGALLTDRLDSSGSFLTAFALLTRFFLKLTVSLSEQRLPDLRE